MNPLYQTSFAMHAPSGFVTASVPSAGVGRFVPAVSASEVPS